MKQIYYTSCLPGRSVGGQSGFQVRAVSSELPVERRQSAERYLGYSLPQGMRPDESTVASAPVRLAVVQSPDFGRIIYHSSYVGKDPTTQRFGNYFSHALVDVPAAVGVAQAIRSWGSSFWKRQDVDGPTVLDDVASLPDGGVLRPEGLPSFLGQPGSRDLLQFLVSAILTGNPQTRVFLVAPPEAVAWSVYSLTLLLPPALLKDLTFSTYESDPLSSYARIVGTWWDADRAPSTADLPSSCYDSAGLAFNSHTGRRSNLSRESPYAAQAVQLLAEGRAPELQKFLASEIANRISQTTPVDIAFAIHTHLNQPTADDIRGAIRHQELLPVLLSNNATVLAIIRQLFSDPTLPAAEVVAALPRNQHADVVRLTTEEVVQSIWRGELDRARFGIDQLLIPLKSRPALLLWKRIVCDVSDTSHLPFELRVWVLAQAAAYPELDKSLQKWLACGSRQLADLLTKLEFAARLRCAACLACMDRAGVIDQDLERALADWTNQHGSDLAIEVLQRLAAQPAQAGARSTNETLARDLLLGLVGQVGDKTQLIDSILRNRKRFSGSFLMFPGFLQMVFETEASAPSPNSVAAEFLAEVGTNASLDQRIREHADTIVRLTKFLSTPSLQTTTPAVLARCLNDPRISELFRKRVMAAIAAAIVNQRDQVAQNFANILREIGPRYPSGTVGLYQELQISFSRGNALWADVKFLEDCLAVLLGEAPRANPLPEDVTSALLDSATQLAKDAHRRGGVALIVEIDRATQHWSDVPKQKWRQLVRAHRLSEPPFLVRACRALLRLTLICGGWFFRVLPRVAFWPVRWFFRGLTLPFRSSPETKQNAGLLEDAYVFITQGFNIVVSYVLLILAVMWLLGVRTVFWDSRAADNAPRPVEREQPKQIRTIEDDGDAPQSPRAPLNPPSESSTP